jgi:hypothetical protein
MTNENWELGNSGSDPIFLQPKKNLGLTPNFPIPNSQFSFVI